MSELEETRALLRDVVSLFRQELEEHNKSMDSFRRYFGELMEHHNEEMRETHRLLHESEERIAKTNAMISSLADTVNGLASTDSVLKDSYLERFKEVSDENKILLDERSRILKENEAYHNAIKLEREKNDRMMESLVQNLCNKAGGSLVNIHQT